VDLGTIREITQPWHDRFPLLVGGAFLVMMAIVTAVLYQFLFLTPIKKPDTGQPIVKFENNVIGQLIIGSSGQISAQPPSPPPVAIPAIDVNAIVENGGFAHGTAAWGTGWFEGLFMRPPGEALAFNRAIARWYIDDRMARNTGRMALRIEHDSGYSPHVFSSFSQRIKIKPSQRYEVKFWAYLQVLDQGALSLRVLPSRTTTLEEWDRFKVKPNPTVLGQWQEVRGEFESGADWFFDLRFAAEAPLKAWVTDVSVAPIQTSHAR